MIYQRLMVMIWLSHVWLHAMNFHADDQLQQILPIHRMVCLLLREQRILVGNYNPQPFEIDLLEAEYKLRWWNKWQSIQHSRNQLYANLVDVANFLSRNYEYMNPEWVIFSRDNKNAIERMVKQWRQELCNAQEIFFDTVPVCQWYLFWASVIDEYLFDIALEAEVKYRFIPRS